MSKRLGECKVCGEQAYYRGKESDWRITYTNTRQHDEPIGDNSTTWVHNDWGRKEYDHDAEPVVFTHLLVVEIDSYLSDSREAMLEMHMNTEPFWPKLIGHKIIGKDTLK